MSVNVEFRKDRKKWQVTYYLDGKRKRPLFDEKIEANNFARKIRLGLSPEARNSITVAESAKMYFDTESQRKSVKSKANDRRYLNLIEHFMFTYRGIERLGTIELCDMEAFRDWLPLQVEYDDKPISMGPSTVNRCLRVLKHFFKRHIQWKNIKENPCFYLEYLDAEEKERKVMGGEAYLLAAEKAPDWFKSAMAFIYHTGAPGSCVERLTWNDVNLAERSFFLLRKKGRKAKWKRVQLPMTESVYALLAEIRSRLDIANGPVFRDAKGRTLLADRICKVGNRAIRDAGLTGVTLYSLRHALGSDMTTANVATELVRQAMGHANIATTQRYANKVGLKPVAGALEKVRGGSLVANE